ncbi:DUF3939 domain-containing protein [Bacillus sp. Marseille-P3661]|uniref:DUF3939 domain-containing protein n=1 Tax=Bacillus sp. Marseille-P3661 TaxID=1936234 RepID=UPI000C81AD82|nr:DUF3939 domain-containing protein [Bacillus sp. Marseille-P3661]
MWPWKKSNNTTDTKNTTPDIISTDLNSVKEAIRAFANDAPTGVTTKVLVKHDHTIDFELLVPYLKGLPEKDYYMSKETYEVFEENEKDIPKYLDLVQAAVDAFVNMHQQTPKIPGDPYHKVSYLLLENNGLIHERPPIDFYLTDSENLITHKKPE